MRTLALGAVLALAGAGTAIAAPIDGLWRTETRGGVVRIAPCGAQTCGVLDDAPGLAEDPGAVDEKNRDPAKRTRPIRGLPMLNGFTGGPVVWRGGTIYNPDNGRTYASELRLADPNTLKVKGCVGPFCQTQTWTRVR